jgi:hypothetical protein
MKQKKMKLLTSSDPIKGLKTSLEGGGTLKAGQNLKPKSAIKTPTGKTETILKDDMTAKWIKRRNRKKGM